MQTTKPLITILGPTASGKTRLSALVASRLDAEIISADSRQVYRDMNIGTGKDYEDYLLDNQAVKYHLIDIIDAGESYHIAQFQKDFQEAFQDIQDRGKMAILCGGSGMYIDAVLRDYKFTQVPVNQVLRAELDQKSYEELLIIFKDNPSNYSNLADISTKKRLIRAIEIGTAPQPPEGEAPPAPRGGASSYLTPPLGAGGLFGILLPTELRRERISKRLKTRLENGLIEEVEMLLGKGIPPEKLIFYGLEYKFITQYLTSQLTYNQLVTQLETAIHQFAKRQMTYFRGMERKGLMIHWLDGTKTTAAMADEILMATRIF